jgi:hypothetical protein
MHDAGHVRVGELDAVAKEVAVLHGRLCTAETGARQRFVVAAALARPASPARLRV